MNRISSVRSEDPGLIPDYGGTWNPGTAFQLMHAEAVATLFACLSTP